MKVFINGRFLTRPISGVERVAYEVARAIAGLCHELGPARRPRVAIILPRADAETRRTAARCCSEWEFELHHSLTGGHFWEQVEFPIRARNGVAVSFCNTAPAALKRQLVVIHDAQVWTHPQSYTTAFVAFYRLLLPILGRRADAVVAVSEHTRRQLESYGVCPRGQCTVIPNAADHVDRMPARTPALAPEPPFFFALGSAAPHKNLEVIISASRHLSAKDPKIVMSGGRNPKVFRTSAPRSPSGNERVLHLGRVSDEELIAMYRSATAFLFPSLTEGFGLPALEAMRLGCPVIASPRGAIPEVCGDAALYAEPDDPAAWAEAMKRVAADDELRADLRRKGWERARAFSWRTAAQAYLRTVEDIDGR